ncbi:transporter substrate-binding domain-containing protein [Duganella sp. FT135W]|uniref:Transporter substrate-binding domain-containing protein n=1 Tax=Duganella flavida TaxID=2692175 RepID=A0A6L8KEW9_9BURK|nr:transporter substrate-binding domain-containing protein [Duganella flavida]MYM23021.1 transporter substrate-binding domain-containing protein [Duganella flavida]
MKKFCRQPALAICLLLQAVPLMAADAPAEIPILIQEDADATGKVLPPSPIIPGIISLLAAESGLNLVVSPYPWRRAQMMAENGEGLLYGAAITPERSRVFHFTKPLDTVNQWLVSSAQAPLVFQQWENLRGKTISILSGGKYSAEFEERRGKLFAVEQNSAMLANRLKMLAAKRVDAVLIASYLNAPQLEARLNCMYPDSLKWVVAGKPLDTEPMMIAIPKSAPLNSTLPVLNDAIDRLVKSRSLQKFHEMKAPGSNC